MINNSTLETIYEKVKTPYKHGVIKSSAEYRYDSPVVFKHNGKYYMTYVEIDAKCTGGYRTRLAVSDDLVHYNDIGYILTEHNGWDSVQTGGYAQFIDNVFGGINEILCINGKYTFAFLGGNKKGYETDPLSMGLAHCTEIESKASYKKVAAPILSGLDKDARRGETLTIYKGDMFIDEQETLGYRYVCAYNAKDESQRESIFLAVSSDAINWKRYGDNAIIPVCNCDESIRINGDPQVVRIDGLYVMLYFVVDSVKGAYNTFAVSEDLLHWAKWQGKPLMESSECYDNVYAHKQWVMKENGIVYQYYCAVNDKNERTIALAASCEL